jgi:hypothetical protein
VEKKMFQLDIQLENFCELSFLGGINVEKKRKNRKSKGKDGQKESEESRE